MSKLVNKLISDGYLKTDVIIDAFWEINRIDFVPKEFESVADANVALPIGYGQTISQPLTVAIMMELLDPRKGNRVLDVGSGSGWTTALLSCIVGNEGKVIALEIKKELVKFGKENVDKYKFIENGIAEFYEADGSDGFSKEAPYDRIIVSASAECVPNALKEQLKVGGKMVIPVQNSLWYLEKKGSNEFYKEEFRGFAFVPLITKKNF